MIKLTEQNNRVSIEFDVKELSPAQIRLLKSINVLLAQVTTTDEEGEFFDSSAEAMRLVASLMKQSQFVHLNKNSKIPYADQVIEYAMGTLEECMGQAKIVSYDN